MAGEHKQNFLGRHLVNVKLTGPGSEKDTRHHEIAIEGGATYLPGDALGVFPHNAPELVERIERASAPRATSRSAGPTGATLPAAARADRDLQPHDAEPEAARAAGLARRV